MNSLKDSGQSNLDALAREQGFPDYATMKAWERHRSESLTKKTTVAKPGPAASPAPRPAERQPNEGVFGYIIRKLGGG